MRLVAALLCALVGASGLLVGVWLLYPPAVVLVGAVLLLSLGYGLLTDEERARL